MNLKNLANCVIVISVLLASSSCVHHQNVRQKLDSFVDALAQQGKFSGAILVARGDKILLSKGYGKANYELDVANTSQTKFRLASVTKQFTAMAIMQLQEQGLLNVHDMLAKHITDYPNGDKITIHHLLTHSSGIPDLTSFENFRTETIKPHTPEQLVELFKNKPLEFRPGEKYSYSNSGYILLGYLIEIVSKKKYEHFLKENIFDPLLMKNSGYDMPSAILKNRASGYMMADDALANSDYVDMSFPFSAGGLYSTVEDMYAWNMALYGKSIFSQDIVSKIFTPHIARDEETSYGYGWLIHKSNDRNVVGHAGGIEGFSTIIRRFMDEKVCIIVLGNFEDLDRSGIAKGLAAIVFGQPYELPKKHIAITMDPAIYDQYAGTYRFKDDGFILKIIKENNLLFSCPDEENKIELFPESKTDFFHKNFEAQISFTKDKDGRVTGFIFRNSNGESPAEKIPDTDAKS